MARTKGAINKSAREHAQDAVIATLKARELRSKVHFRLPHRPPPGRTTRDPILGS